MPRLTKIYTRQGDEGYTTLGAQRLSKDDLLLETIGSLDELNSALGMVLAYPITDHSVRDALTRMQHDLFDLGGELHLPEHKVMTAEKITQLEQILDAWNATLPSLQEFILPRGTLAVAACHLARTICRRAERCMVKLHRQVTLSNPEMLRYINRLSDVLFVMARVLAREGKQEEVYWGQDR